MTWADDDAAEIAARRRPDTGRYANRNLGPGGRLAVPITTHIPGRTFALTHITPGWLLYTTRTLDAALDPAGVVVETIHHQHTDPETGEIVAATRYRVYNPWTNRYDTIDAAEIDTNQLAGLDRRTAGLAARRIVRPLVQARRGQATDLDRRDIDALHDAWRLAAAVAL
jgi:hypothetical protein